MTKVALKFIVLLLVSVLPWSEDLLGLEAGGKTITLNPCSDDKLNISMKCNPDWILESHHNSIMMIILDDVDILVTVTINRSNQKGASFAQLTPDYLRFNGQYDNEMRIDKLKVDGLDALRVKAKAKDLPEMQLLDYYVVKDKYLYTILFSVNPAHRFEDFSGLFEEMIKSFEFLYK